MQGQAVGNGQKLRERAALCYLRAWRLRAIPRLFLLAVTVILSQTLAFEAGVIRYGVAEAMPLGAENSSVKIDLIKNSFLVAHLDEYEEDDEDDDDDREGRRRHKNCHRKKHYRFCGPKSLNVETIQDLNFGRVVADSRHGGTVVIHADTGSKTVNRLYDAGGVHSRAEFEIKGKPNKHFVITLPARIVLPISSGKEPRVGRFTAFPSTTGTLGADGKAIIFIGGTLKLGPTQQGGEGSGPVPIYVDYVR
jgi:hypothetical protein